MTRGITATERQLLEEESRRIWEIMRDERDVALRRVEAAEVSATLLREALEQVQWCGTSDIGWAECPVCNGEERHNPPLGYHEEWCFISNALAADAGAKMLAEVKRLRELLRMARALASLAAAAGDCPYQLAREFLTTLDAEEVAG